MTEEIPQLDCHFKWFNELNIASNGKWLSSLLHKKLHKDMGSTIQASEVDKEALDEEATKTDLINHNKTDEAVTLTSGLKCLSWQFTLLLRDTFELKFKEAFEKANELCNSKEAKNPCQPQTHIDTFYFVVLANQLNILKQWRSSSECPMDENMINDIASRLNELSSSVDTNEGQAFINSMKCNLSRDIQDSKLRLDFAMKAAVLNPQCAAWHQNLYWALREHRRSIDFRQRPSLHEINACKKAFELESGGDPNNISLLSALTMSRLYGELLFKCSYGSQEHAEITDQALKFARVTMQLKPNWKIFKIRLASLLSGNQVYTRSRNEFLAEAQTLIEECEVGECSSEMCHKIGKFYCNRNYTGYNIAKGLEWFENGLKAHAGNFPCFMDMLRNADFQRKSTFDIIEKIETALSSQNKRQYKSQLMFAKGFFLWRNDKEATIDLWLKVLEEAADLEIDFVSLATGNLCFVNNKYKALNMMENAKDLMNRGDRANDQNFTKLMDAVNSVIAFFATLRYVPGGKLQQRNENWRRK